MVAKRLLTARIYPAALAVLVLAFGGLTPAMLAGQQGRRSATEVPEPGELKLPPSEMRGLIERHTADRGSLLRSYPVEISPARRARLKQFYGDWLAALGGLDFDSMSQDGKVDYLLFKNYLTHELRDLDIQAKALAEVAPLLPFSQTITDLAEARRRMEPINAAKAAAALHGLSRQIDSARREVEAGLKGGSGEDRGGPAPIKKAVANRAVATLGSLRTALRAWYGFYNGYDPVFTWWAGEPYQVADGALATYATLLAERVVGVKLDDAAAAARPDSDRGRDGAGGTGARTGAGPGRLASVRAGDSSDIVGDPIGREALLSELASEMIPYTPEELIAIGHRELAWCEAEMKKAARELGYGDDWRKALEHVKTLYVEPGKQPELIRGLAAEAIKFIDDHDLVTVPPLAREGWRMEMMSPERQLVTPFFTGGETISVSFPTSAMPHEAKLMSMRGNNIHFSRATVHHELIPGHHLQGFMTARYKPYRSLFSTPFWGEGWALYWELLLWDMNFARSPEDRIGMLFWRMHRGARIVFSLGFHLGQMTPQECIELLVKRVGHEPENATAEVRRSFAGNYGPLYQAAYLLGGLQFYALHKELVGPGKLSNRAFHDAVLKENRIPIAMVRALLTKQKLTRDYAADWKFYGTSPGGR